MIILYNVININFVNAGYNKVSVNIYDLNGRLIESLYNDYLDYGEYNFGHV